MVLWLCLGVTAIVAGATLRVAVPTYARLRGVHVVRCPATRKPAEVEIKAALAAVTAALGEPVRRVAACSCWPARRGCDEACLLPIDRAPEATLARTLVARFYAGKPCALCHEPLDEDAWEGEGRAALLAPDGRVVDSRAIRLRRLLAALPIHRPVCPGCRESGARGQSPPDPGGAPAAS